MPDAYLIEASSNKVSNRRHSGRTVLNVELLNLAKVLRLEPSCNDPVVRGFTSLLTSPRSQGSHRYRDKE